MGSFLSGNSPDCFTKDDIDLKVRQVIANSITGLNVDEVFLGDELQGNKLGFDNRGIRGLSVPLSDNDGVFRDIPELQVPPGELVPASGGGVSTVGDISALVWSKIPDRQCEV